ncbi:MAG: CinA family protein [Rubripirellula sp.]
MANELAIQLAERLANCRTRIVFAESCTGGLISAEMARVPGISEWLCGSAVTYRCETKSAWLDVSRNEIEVHTAVSDVVASEMAEGVLRKTSEASLALSVTGHLGPGAPEGFDGLVFVGIALRTSSDRIEIETQRHQLLQSTRVARQSEAAAVVMQAAMSVLAE